LEFGRPRDDRSDWGTVDDECFDGVCDNVIPALVHGGAVAVDVYGVGSHPSLLGASRLQRLFSRLPPSLRRLCIHDLFMVVPSAFEMLTSTAFPHLVHLSVRGDAYGYAQLEGLPVALHGLQASDAACLTRLCHGLPTLRSVELHRLTFIDLEAAKEGYEHLVQAVCGSEAMAGLLQVNERFPRGLETYYMVGHSSLRPAMPGINSSEVFDGFFTPAGTWSSTTRGACPG